MKYLLLLVILLGSCFNESTMSFERIDAASDLARCSNKEFLCYTECFIVHNYSENKSNEMKMDSFVCELIEKDSIDYIRHWINFYQPSRKTNILYIEKRTKYWDAIELRKDFLLSYEFKDSQFKHKTYGMRPIIKIVNSNEFSCE